MDKKNVLKAALKKSETWSPNDREFTPAPSTSTQPGPNVQFSRPRGVAPTGEISKTPNKISNFRTLGQTAGQSGPLTLPKAKGEGELLKRKLSPMIPNAKSAPLPSMMMPKERTSFPVPKAKSMPSRKRFA